MPNHLIDESSPYLLQHADNPVDWYPWGAEALAKARQEDKPIFLSIGYAACHWCHVMAHESFEDPAIAELMNTQFVCIKVDREERPDLDSIYMSFVVATTGQGGWPMSLFLTPEGKPFYGGTYFPPARIHNLPALREVLEIITQLWNEDRNRLLSSSEDLTAWVQANKHNQAQEESLSDQALDQVVDTIAQGYDWQNGGWGGAPKFPQPMLVEFLLRRGSVGDQRCLEMSTHVLRAMAQGGMYDLLGGGFARYSVDESWFVPHFEKMLYDNAQLALVYLHAYQLTGENAFREVCESTLDFVLREMMHPEGGFFSSLDADSEGEEGKYYLWTPEEIGSAISDTSEAELVLAAYNISDQGNFNGKNILRHAQSDAELADRFHVPLQELPVLRESLNKRLLEVRSHRVHPATDDKVITSWNALMLKTFAEAGRALGESRYIQSAIKNADFLLQNMFINGHLKRTWRNGVAKHGAYLEDYAGLALGLLTLYQTDPDTRWYRSAIRLVEELVKHFSDPLGGFFDTGDDHESLLYRPKELQDNATPSGNALAATALLQLATFEGRQDWRTQADRMISSNLSMIKRYPSAFAQWLCAIEFALSDVREIAILGELDHPSTQSFIHALWHGYYPHMVMAVSTFPPPSGSPALLDDRALVNGKPTAYVCKGFVCQQPVNDPEEILAQL